jgi:hypothetical protein
LLYDVGISWVVSGGGGFAEGVTFN